MRKELKKQALQRLKKCYWMMVVLCLGMAILGIDYGSSLKMIKTDINKGVEPNMQEQVIGNILLGNEKESTRQVNEFIRKQKNVDNKFGIIAASHSRGVLAQLVNDASSGKIYTWIYSAIQRMTDSKRVSIIIFIFLGLMFMLVSLFLVNGLYKVTAMRFAMEYRIYDKVPMKRFLYVLSIRRTGNIFLTMALTGIYKFLWNITIIGGVIKGYSYCLVPYILSENPTISPKKAITLSRRMMDGHKFEAFKLELSFLGWNILEFFTMGFTGILFSNPYKEMTWAEYYFSIRSLAKEEQIENVDLLNDIYLYEKADKELLRETYSDLQQTIAEAEVPIVKHRGVRGFLENVFGVVLFCDKDELDFRDKKAKQLAVHDYKEICEQNMYPIRLLMDQHKERAIKLSSIQYDRHYTIRSLILIFFTMSFIGWCWEVSLHLISDGVFVNRGFYHGPWLPIYGYGGVLILVMLYRFREKIFLEFFSGIVLCGLVEYCTAWYMETTQGAKWWDYSGYFLNIHGRICAEGLLVFGLGGLAIVYLLAPFLDNLFRRIPRKAAILLVALLIISFTGDGIYSQFHPNAGDGITSVSANQAHSTEETENT